MLAGMDIYLLERIGGTDYDEAAGFVVVAESPDEARRLAAEQYGDEGSDTWLAPSRSTCKVIDSTRQGVVLRDFRAG
jgi:hypothetical protein